jgi:hypothetical protein
MKKLSYTRPSRLLFILTFILITVFAGNILYIYFAFEQLHYDAMFIDNLVMIHGMIQRITKLELSGTNTEPQVKVVNSLFIELRAIQQRAYIFNEYKNLINITELGSSESTSEFFRRADTALYQAKENGRNRIVTLPLSEGKRGHKGQG